LGPKKKKNIQTKPGQRITPPSRKAARGRAVEGLEKRVSRKGLRERRGKESKQTIGQKKKARHGLLTTTRKKKLAPVGQQRKWVGLLENGAPNNEKRRRRVRGGKISKTSPGPRKVIRV